MPSSIRSYTAMKCDNYVRETLGTYSFNRRTRAHTDTRTHGETAPFVWEPQQSARLHRVQWPQWRLVQFVANCDPDKAPIFGDVVYCTGACQRVGAGCSDFSEAIFVAWRRRKHDKNVPQALGLPNVPLRATAASTAMTPRKMATLTCQLQKSPQ